MRGLAELHYRNADADLLLRMNEVHPKDYHQVMSSFPIIELDHPGDVVDMVLECWKDNELGRPPGVDDVLVLRVSGQEYVRAWVLKTPEEVQPGDFWSGYSLREIKNIWTLGCKLPVIAAAIPFSWDPPYTRLIDIQE